ncbi:MAG: hypothetical protein J1F10_04390 [Muribaculaceae bacterium]|nr:hypothetical protein [Muribaculaceae bacterium]
MSKYTISTFSRYIYLNSYAFLLLFMGLGIVFIPLYVVSWWLVPIQAIVVIVCLKGCYGIFSTWDDKKRKYKMLIERNKEQLRPDIFTEFMQAPCGQLLSKVVLQDLGKSDSYQDLVKLRKPLITRLRESCKPQKTTIYINEDYKP